MDSLLSRGYLLFVGAFSLWACYSAFRDRVTVAIADDWRILDDFYSMSLLEWMFSSHIGHRTPFVFGLFALDYEFLEGRQDLLVVATMATAWLGLAVLYFTYRNAGAVMTPLSNTAFGFAAFSTFWAGTSYNFLWGVCQGNLMVAFWLFVALSFMLKFVGSVSESAPRRSLLTAAGVAAFLATFSLGEGVATWVGLFAIAIIARLPVRVPALLVIGALLTVGIYGIGLESNGEFSFTTSAGVLFRPLDLLLYVATFVGGAFGQAVGGLGLAEGGALERVSTGFGVVGLGLSALFVCWLLRDASRASPRALLAVGITAFAIGSGLVAAAARLPMELSGFAPRYTNWSALFWMGLFFAIPQVWTARKSSVAVAAIALLSVAMVPGIESSREVVLRVSRSATQGAVALMLGIESESIATAMGMRGAAQSELMFRAAKSLREDRRNLFLDPRTELPGTPLQSHYSVVGSDQCQGKMKAPKSIEDATSPAARVGGWTSDGSRTGAPAHIAITDTRGVIRGLGLILPKGILAKAGGTRFGWSGYIAQFDPSERYVAHAVLADGLSACPIEGPRTR